MNLSNWIGCNKYGMMIFMSLNNFSSSCKAKIRINTGMLEACFYVSLSQWNQLILSL